MSGWFSVSVPDTDRSWTSRRECGGDPPGQLAQWNMGRNGVSSGGRRGGGGRQSAAQCRTWRGSGGEEWGLWYRGEAQTRRQGNQSKGRERRRDREREGKREGETERGRERERERLRVTTTRPNPSVPHQSQCGPIS